MTVATFRRKVATTLRDFAWDQWSQVGVSGAAPKTPDRRVVDPEALLLFTLEVGRHDPRLFDEVLDWLVLNEPLVSVQRLRNLCLDTTDRALVDAALTWVARWRPRARLSSKTRSDDIGQPPKPLFVGLSVPERDIEPSFARMGLLRPEFEPSRKSQLPDYSAAINLAFRLRRFLGIGARAEVVRLLLTTDAPSVTAGVVHASAGFARPNVREALVQLHDAGVTEIRGARPELRYTLRRDDWRRLLHISQRRAPEHRDWIQTLGPLRLVLRWLYDERTPALSEYMRASEARVMLDRLESNLRFAGFHVEHGTATGVALWDGFVRTIDEVLASL